jgi:diketogulonate reductase-like aldo/keto reductase
MKTVLFPGGSTVPALGLGTWRLGESAGERKAEIGVLRLALEMGYRLIDTAEMYGEGGAEEVVGEGLSQAMRSGTVKRADVFIVSKVYPQNASRAGVVAACERSLRRLQVDCIDLYLLHWPGSHPLQDTVAGFESLQRRGSIGAWGVSNTDTADLKALWAFEAGRRCATNQIYYSLSERGPEFDVLPWQRAHDVPTMAYSPIDQGTLAADGALRPLAETLGVTPAQLALAWVMAAGDVIAIPKAGRETHLLENFAAAELALDVGTLRELDQLFPPPRRKSSLAMR